MIIASGTVIRATCCILFDTRISNKNKPIFTQRLISLLFFTLQFFSRGYQKDQRLWDSFQDPPDTQTDGSAIENQRFGTCKKWMKAFTYLFVFSVTLAAGVVSKTTFLLMVTFVRPNSNVAYCDLRCE